MKLTNRQRNQIKNAIAATFFEYSEMTKKQIFNDLHEWEGADIPHREGLGQVLKLIQEIIK